MTYKIEFSEDVLAQFSILRKGDKNAYIKCFDLVLAIAENPREGIGKPERLKGFGEREVYSRRVNDKDRLVYTVFEEPYYKVEIVSCLGHYNDH
jgi:toxin YoeB